MFTEYDCITELDETIRADVAKRVARRMNVSHITVLFEFNRYSAETTHDLDDLGLMQYLAWRSQVTSITSKHILNAYQATLQSLK